MTHDKGFFFYLVFGLGSLLLSGLSFGFWMFNPLPFASSNIATPLVQLLGRMTTLGPNDLGVILWIGLLWPLTLAPLHWLTFSILRRSGWAYLALLLLAGVLIAFGIQLYHSHLPFPSLPRVRHLSLSDSPISLRVGETREFVADNLRLTFLRVIEAEACTNGENCDEQKPTAIELSTQLGDGEPSTFVFETLFSVAQVPGIEQGSFYYISWQAITPLSAGEFMATFDVYIEIHEP